MNKMKYGLIAVCAVFLMGADACERSHKVVSYEMNIDTTFTVMAENGQICKGVKIEPKTDSKINCYWDNPNSRW
jgi:hypothetical protein